MPVLNRRGARVYVAVTLGLISVIVIFLIISFTRAENFEVYQLEVEGGKTHEIKYDIEGSKVQSIAGYPESFSIVIEIEEAPEQGSLKMQFNRDDMAELLGNEGQQVSAFVDEKPATFAMGIPSARGSGMLSIGSSDTVTVTIDFAKGSEVIELMGARYD